MIYLNIFFKDEVFKDDKDNYSCEDLIPQRN